MDVVGGLGAEQTSLAVKIESDAATGLASAGTPPQTKEEVEAVSAQAGWTI